MLTKRRVKIVATIGPSTSSEDGLRKCIEAGMNVARLNFSHGSHEDHKKVIHLIRKLSKELKAPVTILQDLQGPKIRVGKFEHGSIELKREQIVKLTTENILGKDGLIPLDFDGLPKVCFKGLRVLLDDGLLELEVIDSTETEIEAKVIHGGVLKDRKGLNVPGTTLPIQGMTEKDREDLKFGLEEEVDYVALSFVRSVNDLKDLRQIIKEKESSAKVISKIEMLEAVQNLEDIIKKSDAVMVARGDLAIEVGQSQLPGIQKRIVKLSNELNRPVITATQMLDSMVNNPRPTRAEVTDIANAVLDGTDALMLSAETASGKYPFRCIRTMHEISREVEKNSSAYYKINLGGSHLSIAESIAISACLTAQKLDATVIVCLTTTGKTAAMISRYRPKARIIALTHIISTLNRLEATWGIQTLPISPYGSSDEAMQLIEQKLLRYNLVKPKDRVILTYGSPVIQRAKTNTLRVYTIGEPDQNKESAETFPLRCQPLRPIDIIENE